MAYALDITIPGLPRINASDRRHWRIILREKQRWQRAVAMAMLGQPKPEQPLLKAELTCIRRSSSAPDYDNLVAGFKSLIDELVNQGVLIDDQRGNFSAGVPRYEWEKAAPKKGEVVLRVRQAA